MIRAALLALGAGLLATPALAADALVATLSTDSVRIESNFTGTGITVFGAVQSNEAAVPGVDVQLAILLEGPPETIVTRRKESILGLWINRGAATFTGVPEYYALHTTAELDAMARPEELRTLRLGVANLPLVSPLRPVTQPFRDALVRLKREQGHFVEEFGTIESPGATLFRTTFELPADIPVGDYRVTILLFRDGIVTATTTTPLSVAKSGAEQFLYDAAHGAAWAYALAIVAIAGAIGWLGGVIFRRD